MSATWLDNDKFHDECGIFGVFDHPEAANLAYLGLYALQHRGQESAGIAASDGTTLHVEKAMGWVADVFGPERLKRLPGRSAMGHVRYSTAGSSTLRNAQPITATFSRGSIALEVIHVDSTSAASSLGSQTSPLRVVSGVDADSVVPCTEITVVSGYRTMESPSGASSATSPDSRTRRTSASFPASSVADICGRTSGGGNTRGSALWHAAAASRARAAAATRRAIGSRNRIEAP